MSTLETKIVPLSDAFDGIVNGAAGKISEITLNPPMYPVCAELGDPDVLARTPDGALYHVYNDATVKAYIERCATGFNPAYWPKVSLVDYLKLRQAVCDFFETARRAISPSLPNT